MEVVATQPSTLPPTDGAYTAVEYDDVLCILQPASQPAVAVCQEIWKTTPQFILQYSNAALRADGTIQQEDDLEMIGGEDTQGTKPQTDNVDKTITNHDGQLAVQHHQPSNLDIALRTSTPVKDILLGFTFGRDLYKSDIPLGTKTAGDARISSMHFRIYLNHFGFLICEDTSTNGTTVDDEILGKKQKNLLKQIAHGTTIEFVTNANRATRGVERATFVVKLPKRNDVAYHENLREYTLKISRQKQERARIGAAGGLFPIPQGFRKHSKNQQLVDVDTDIGRLSAGTERYTLANGWTGNGKYSVVSELGKGAFAIVYKVTTTAGEAQAAKRIDRASFMKNGNLDGKFLNELNIMQKVDHPHVVKLNDHDLTAKYLFIIMEYMPCGDLAPYALPKDYLGLPTLRSIAKQMLHALAYIHRNGIVHRDIKPENILVQSKEPFYVKLSDFGLSKVIDKDDKAAITFCGTLLYCAPEIYPDYEQVRAGLPRVKRKSSAAKPYSSAVDIWSLGTVMYHLIASKPPFKGSGDDQGYKMLRAVVCDPIDLDCLRVRGVNDLGLDFLCSMIDIDGESRPSAQALLQHLWIGDVEDLADIPNLEESQIIGNGHSDPLETLAEEEEWDKPQSESFLKAAGALLKTPTPDAPSLTNGETSADDKQPVVGDEFSDASSQIDVEIGSNGDASHVTGDILGNSHHDYDAEPPIGSVESDRTWYKKGRKPHYGQEQLVYDSPSASEDDTPRQAAPARLFGEISQDPYQESGVFGAQEQPLMYQEGLSNHSLLHNSPSLFGAESRMNNLNFRGSRAQQSVLRSAVTNSMLHGKRYRSTAASGSDESNTSSMEEPAAKRSMVKLGEAGPTGDRTRETSKSTSPDINGTLSQGVNEMDLSGTLLATLTPTADSLSSTPIHLKTRLSNFGRAERNTNVFESREDSRVPRHAFDIYFFAPGNPTGREWGKDPDVNAVIMTRCKTGIKINNVRLPPSTDGVSFKIATLRKGDTVEVYRGTRNKLVYQCDFFIGKSQFPRREGEEVVVEDNAALVTAAKNDPRAAAVNT